MNLLNGFVLFNKKPIFVRGYVAILGMVGVAVG